MQARLDFTKWIWSDRSHLNPCRQGLDVLRKQLAVEV